MGTCDLILDVFLVSLLLIVLLTRLLLLLLLRLRLSVLHSLFIKFLYVLYHLRIRASDVVPNLIDILKDLRELG